MPARRRGTRGRKKDGLGVVLPTRDSMSRIRAHVESMRSWLDLADEIVIVDSRSADGTAEYLRWALPQATFLSTPPGLYGSWNEAVGRVSCEFVYISTVGDSIAREGLQHLLGTAVALDCEVVVSPPRIIDGDGARSEHYEWAVHRFARHANLASPRLLDPLEFLAASVVYLPLCMLGSAASNIFRTRTLQRLPFPVDFGHNGDTAWTVRNALEVRTAVTPWIFSSFVLHGQSRPSRAAQRRLTLRCLREAVEAVRAYTPVDPRAHAAAGLLSALLEAGGNAGPHRSRLGKTTGRRRKPQDAVSLRADLCRVCGLDPAAADLVVI